jgi:hypothetical protein
VRTLLAAGVQVIGVDLLYQGEFLSDGKPPSRGPWLTGEQAFAGWTYCYNLAPLARRAHDILAVVAWTRNQASKPEVDVVALGKAGRWGAAALATARGNISRAAIDTQRFRFAALTDIYDIDFLPGGARYDDLPGMLALAADVRLWLAGEGRKAPDVVEAAYRAAEKLDRLTIDDGPAAGVATRAVAWLLR